MDFTGEEGKVQGRKGLCPVVPGPPSRPLPCPPRTPAEEAFSPQLPGLCLAVMRDSRQEAEGRKQQKQEGGQEEADETTASSHSALPTFRTAKQCFPKYLHESKLMRDYISSDNGRMWGWSSRGDDQRNQAAGTMQGDRAWGKASLVELKEEIPACQHCDNSICPVSLRKKRACCILRTTQSVFTLPFPLPGSAEISSTSF